MEKRNIYLTGFMGAGKSSVGAELAKALGKEFIDLDVEIERTFGQTISDTFASGGEALFRARESMVFERLSSAKDSDKVISLGGGTILNHLDAARKSGWIVYLKADPETLFKRASSDGRDRPLLRGRNVRDVEELLDEREPVYSQADLSVPTDHADVDEVTRTVKESLGRLRAH